MWQAFARVLSAGEEKYPIVGAEEMLGQLGEDGRTSWGRCAVNFGKMIGQLWGDDRWEKRAPISS